MIRRGSSIAWVVAIGVLAATLAATPPVAGSPDAESMVIPAAAAPAPVHFTASGDFSQGKKAGAVLEQIGDIDPDLHLALGDLSYGDAGSEPGWCDFVTSRVGEKFPFQLVAGNHESDGRNGHIDNFAKCLPNRLPGMVGEYARQYFVDVPKAAPLVRFIMISPALNFDDGTWSYEEGSKRYRWTANAIDDARASGVKWIVVGMHKPCLSVGEYGCDPGADIVNLMLKKRVDLVLSGHEHLYARTGQLALSTACPALTPGQFTPGCVADSDNELKKGAGTVFAISGAGGVPLRDIHTDDPEAPYFVATSGHNLQPTWGNLDVSVTTTSLKARFRPAYGETFSDAFSITRPEQPRPGVLARDGFTRVVFNGLGSAEVGGAWSTNGNASRYSVDGGARVDLSPSGPRREATLKAVSSSATDMRVTVSANRWTPIGASVSIAPRQIPGVGAYEARLTVTKPGQLQLSLVRVGASGGPGRVLRAAVTVPRLRPAFDEKIEVRVQAIGVRPTVLRAKVWKAGSTQPSGWLRAVSDATSALQRPGALGFSVDAMDMSSMAPAVVTVDDLLAVVP